MFSPKKLVIGVGITAVLAGGLFAASVFAADPPATPTPSNAKVTLYDNFISKLAENLGITKDKLTGAMTQSETQVIDEAVTSGKLSQQQADKMKQSLKDHPNALGFFEGRGFRGGPGEGRFEGRGGVAQALSELTGKTKADVTAAIQADLKAGKTLEQALANLNVTAQALRDQMVKDIQPKLDQAVKDGKMTQDQETKILDSIKNAPLDGKGLMGFGMHGVREKGNRHPQQQQKPAPSATPQG